MAKLKGLNEKEDEFSNSFMDPEKYVVVKCGWCDKTRYFHKDCHEVDDLQDGAIIKACEEVRWKKEWLKKHMPDKKHPDKCIDCLAVAKEHVGPYNVTEAVALKGYNQRWKGKGNRLRFSDYEEAFDFYQEHKTNLACTWEDFRRKKYHKFLISHGDIGPEGTEFNPRDFMVGPEHAEAGPSGKGRVPTEIPEVD